MSSKVRDLVSQALDIQEDVALTGLAEKRERTFDRSAALSHGQVWTAARTRR